MTYDDHSAAYTVDGFCHAHGVGRTFTYNQIKLGKLHAVKAGARTLILRSEALRWANALPEMGGEHA